MVTLKVIFEDNEILVVHKPAGLATQTKKVGEKDLVSLLKKHLKGGYVGVIHRLDQPVEGLLVFAKNPAAAAKLSRQIQQKGEGAFLKDYTAKVFCQDSTEGANVSAESEDRKSDDCTLPKNEIVRLENFIVKTKDNIAMIVSETDLKKYPDAKRASLTYEDVSYREKDCKEIDYKAEDCKEIDREEADREMLPVRTLMVHLETGRFHQIRAQLSNAGMPILGDRKYGSEESIKLSESLGIKYVALCARHLVFSHPTTGKIMDFEI